MTTKHSTPNGRPLPFGRRCEGDCPRCAELKAGAAPRPGRYRDSRQEAIDRAKERANLAAGRCACGADRRNHICTYKEW